MLEPPDPQELTALRQRWTSERFVSRVALAVLAVAAYVNLVVGLLGSIQLHLGATEMIVVSLALVALPLLGLVGVARYAERNGRAALAAVREALEVEDRSRARLMGGGLFFGMLFVLVPLVLIWDELGRVLFFLGLGLAGPFGRRWMDPSMPRWGLLFISVWVCFGSVWVLALTPALGPDLAFQAGVFWLLLAPFGLPGVFLRNVVPKLALRQDGVGQLARAFAVFLPPAQAARIRRMSDARDALDTLRARFAGVIRGTFLIEALVEAGELLLELGDKRAIGVFSAAARAMPAEARAFAGLARAFREQDPERADAYARFAEENARRGLVGGDAAAAAVREELDA